MMQAKAHSECGFPISRLNAYGTIAKAPRMIGIGNRYHLRHRAIAAYNLRPAHKSNTRCILPPFSNQIQASKRHINATALAKMRFPSQRRDDDIGTPEELANTISSTNLNLRRLALNQ